MRTLSKKITWGLIVGMTLLLMAATVPAAIWLTHTNGAQLENSKRRCENAEKVAVHRVVVQNGAFRPAHTRAKLCDVLVITNLDPQDRLIAFGPHDHHISYDGVSERLVGQGQSFDLKLITPGSYLVHDHLQETAVGSFSVISTR